MTSYGLSRRWFYVLFLLVLCVSPSMAQDLRQVLLDRIGEQTQAVRDELLSLKNLEEIKTFASEKRKILTNMNSIERTEPHINARLIGTIDRNNFTVEKIIFESSPGILVPANIYVPNGITGRVPGILITEGHSAAGKSDYHTMCQSFCAQGFVVMTFDPLGQGERGIYYDRSSGNEHVSTGLQGYCAGVHMSKLFIGDGLYAIDYLLSRDDVDPNRICVTGNSGGGAQALYLGALDERIAVTIPSCFTTLDSMVVAITATHPESNYFGAFAQGITMETLCAMIAPRGLLINASKEDFFPIEGTRVVYDMASKVFAAAGVPGNVALFEGEGGHAYTEEKRGEAYKFLSKFFGTEPKTEPSIDPIPAEELNCTETFNMEDIGSKTLFDLIRNRALELRQGRPERIASMSRSELKNVLKQALGIDRINYIPQLDIVSDNYSNNTRNIVFKYNASDGFPLTGEGFTRTDTPDRLTVIVSPLSEISSYQLALPYLSNNDAVLIARPRGTAWAPYTMEGMFKIGITNRDYYFAMGAFNAGRTVVGIQTTDVLELIRLVLEIAQSINHIRIIGDELLAPAAICTAVFLDEASELVIECGLWGYEGIATNRVYGYYLHPEVITIRGILEHFDLPELALASGCEHVIWKSPADHNGSPLEKHGLYEFTTLVSRLSKVFGMEGKVEVE
ncbi:MAG: acetylxylan esterase [Candidatus Latescibacteria bacterium]|nr:acetylxylan esterase [Candidatus Latescibacterota bacterium]